MCFRRIPLTITVALLCCFSGPRVVLAETPVVSVAAREQLALLDADSWLRRESASEWLVAHPEEWARALPISWKAETAEGEWRLRQVRAELAQLASLPSDVAALPWGQLCWKLDQMHRRYPEGAHAAIRVALGSTFQRVRQRAVELTERLPVPTRLELLAPLEHDSSPWVRHSMYEALARVSPVDAREVLVRTLTRHESAPLTRAAILATRPIGVDEELGALIRKKWNRRDRGVRQAIASVLLRELKAEEREVCHWAIADGEFELVRLALVALESYPALGDTPAVAKVLVRPEPELRPRAAVWLVKHGSKAHAAEITPYVESADRELVRLAIGILASWKAVDQIPDVDAALTRIRAPRRWLQPPAGAAWVHATAHESGTIVPAIPGSLPPSDFPQVRN